VTDFRPHLAVPSPDRGVIDQTKSNPLNHTFGRAFSHTILLLGIILLGFHTFHSKPIWAVMYLLFAIGAQVSWVRYYSCTRCPHYGRVCPSLICAGILGSRWFKKREGRWDDRDWLALFLTWGLILFLPALFALVRGQLVLTGVNLLFVTGFFLVHNEMGCKSCRNAPYCPKGVFAHNPSMESFLRMIPYVGERIARSATSGGPAA